jgi:hypothetical protein
MTKEEEIKQFNDSLTKMFKELNITFVTAKAPKMTEAELKQAKKGSMFVDYIDLIKTPKK